MATRSPPDTPAWQTQRGETWKLSLPCNRADAERLAEPVAVLDALDPPPVTLVSEPDPAQPDAWLLEIYFEGRPDDATIALCRGQVAGGDDAVPEQIVDRDWVTLSQAWLEPIRAARFYIHTAAHAANIPKGAVPFCIEAGRAFGTGHHETTAGCLEMLDSMATDGTVFASIADIGTGTGLLAFAAQALWPAAHIIATDIDSIAIEVMAENMAANAVPAPSITLAVADGMDHPDLGAAMPFDLLIANILAGPLIALAPDIARSMKAVGTVVLSGLLAAQADIVAEAFRAEGFTVRSRLDRGDWAILRLVTA